MHWTEIKCPDWATFTKKACHNFPVPRQLAKKDNSQRLRSPVGALRDNRFHYLYKVLPYDGKLATFTLERLGFEYHFTKFHRASTLNQISNEILHKEGELRTKSWNLIILVLWTQALRNFYLYQV